MLASANARSEGKYIYRICTYVDRTCTCFVFEVVVINRDSALDVSDVGEKIANITWKYFGKQD